MGKLIGASLFSGSGGMDLGVLGGFSYLGKRYVSNPIDIVYALDNNERACELYNENFSGESTHGSIGEVTGEDIPPIHIIFGGFPCQSFSIVAQNPPRLGYKDGEYGLLVLDMARLIRERKPEIFVAENVKGLLSANKGKAFPLVINEFKDAGYYVKWALLNASDYGIPQKRERVFIVGFLNKNTFDRFEFPQKRTETAKVPLYKVLIPENEIEEKYYFTERAVKGLRRASKNRKDMDKGRVQNPDEPSNTVSAHLAKVSLNSFDPVLKINGRYRMYTPREVARIQSFPENYKLTGSKTALYRALGNAVPPVMMWHLTRSIVAAIEDTDKQLYKKKPYRTKKEKRSYNMSRIKAKDTDIELTLRKALWAQGLRYRVSPKNIHGKPDIVFKSKKVAVFCDSSFWHGRDFEEATSRIKTNKDYWVKKIRRNKERDQEVNNLLKGDGWKVLRFWDDEILENLNSVVNEIYKSLT